MHTLTAEAHAASIARDPRPHAAAHARHDATISRIDEWSPWAGRQRPSTAVEEDAFVARLRELSNGGDRQESPQDRGRRRCDITVVVTALRSAVTADELLRNAPGIRADTMLAAYESVEARRAASERAWRMLAADPTRSTLDDVGSGAAGLLPLVINRLRNAVTARPAEAFAFSRTISLIDRRIRATQARALELEDQLAGSAGTAGADRAAELLHDAWGDGVWSLGTYLAPRVGTIVATRLRSLLDEG
jgi:hypothetical protein